MYQDDASQESYGSEVVSHESISPIQLDILYFLNGLYESGDNFEYFYQTVDDFLSLETIDSLDFYFMGPMPLNPELRAQIDHLALTETPLTMAICTGKLENVKLILDEGADPNFRNYNKMLPLDLAYKVMTSDYTGDGKFRGNCEIIEALKLAGAKSQHKHEPCHQRQPKGTINSKW